MCRRGHVACTVDGEGLNTRLRPRVAPKAPKWAGIEEAIRAAEDSRSREARTTHRLLRELREEFYGLGLLLADLSRPASRRAGRAPEAGAGMGRRVERVPAAGAGTGRRVERAPEGVAGPGPRTQENRRGAERRDAAEDAEGRARKRRRRVRSAEVIDLDDE